MKCPKCEYTSFDHLTSCKKCGYLFKKNGGAEQISWVGPSVAEPAREEEEEEHTQTERNAEVSDTVASLRSILDDLDSDRTPDATDLYQREADKHTESTPQRGRDEVLRQDHPQFPSFDAVNWDESISLASDELYLDVDDHPGAAKGKEIRFQEEDAELAQEKISKIKEELVRVEEELKEIEETPADAMPPLPTVYSEAPVVVAEVKKGGFWIRCVASIIDSAILITINFILVCIGIIAMGLGPSELEALEGGSEYGLTVPVTLFSYFITIVYYTYFHGSTGQTPGKMACRLKVIRVDGTSLGYGKAFIRWLGYIVSSVVFCLGYLWVAWDAHKQGWHDKIAHTYVIRV